MNLSCLSTISAVEQKTGNLYADIWDLFTDEQYIRLSENIWGDLFRLHEPLATYVKGANVLDAGCGGGSGVLMMLREGASCITGIDLSTRALDHTRRMVQLDSPDMVDQVRLLQHSVLELPFEDETFDFVYSNGVLHHTSDPRKGFSELVRVIKPGGTLWVGLYGAGGLMTGLLIPMARHLRNVVPYALTKNVLSLFTRDPLALYRVLDPMYTPYRFSYRASDIIGWIESSGLTKPMRTFRCAQSFYGFGPWMSGEGWVGFRAFKPAKGVNQTCKGSQDG